MAAEAERGNRIGIGVGIDDPGGSALAYLRDVNAEISRLKQNVVNIPTIPRQIREAAAGPSANQVREKGREVVQATHEIAEGMARETRAITNQLNLFDREVNASIEKVAQSMRAAGTQMNFPFTRQLPVLQPFGPPSPGQTGPYYGPPSPVFNPAIRGPINAGTPLNITAAQVKTDAEMTARYDALRQKWIDQDLLRQQKKATLEEYNLEQMVRSGKTVGQINREREAELDVEAQMVVLKKKEKDAVAERVRILQSRGAQDIRTQYGISPGIIGRRLEGESGGPPLLTGTQRMDLRVAGLQIPESEFQRGIATGGPGNPAALARQAASIQSVANSLTSTFNRVERSKNSALDMRAQAQTARQNLLAVHTEAAALAREIEGPANKQRPWAMIEADLKRLRAELNETKREASQMQITLANAAGGAEGGGGGPKSPEGGFGGPLSGQNFAFAAQRITRNLILYRAFSILTTDLNEYVRAAVAAVEASNDLDRAIRSEAITAQTSSQAIFANAEALRSRAGLSSIQARQVGLAGLRFAEDDPIRAPEITAAATNLAASRGIRGPDVAQFLDQLRSGNPRFYRSLFGRTPDDIYRATAEKAVDRGEAGPVNNYNDYSDKFQTRYQAVQKYLGAMSEAQKAEARYDDLLQRSSQFTTQAAERQDDLAGRLDRLKARWADVQLGVGQTILQLEPLNDIIQNLSENLANVDFSKLKGAGPGGVLAPEQLGAFQQAFIQGPANQYGGRGSVLGSLYGVGKGVYEGGLISGLGRGVLGITGLESIIPGAGGGLSDEQITTEQANRLFYGTRQAQLQQVSREGTYRYRLNEGERARAAQLLGRDIVGSSITNDELLQLQGQGFNPAAGGDRGYTENAAQRAARAVEDRRLRNEEVTRKERERQESDEATQRNNEQKKEAQELLNRQASGLAKLREMTLSTYNDIGRIASAKAVDNPFVKLFSDAETSAQRMQLQYGSLGDSVVQFYTKLEKQNLALATSAQRFEALASATNSIMAANRLERERGVGINGTEGRLLGVGSAAINAALENPLLYERARNLQQFGRPGRGQANQLRERYENLYQAQQSFSALELGPEAQDALQKLFDDGFIKLAEEAGPRIFTGILNGLRIDAEGAYRRSAGRNDREVDRAVQKLVIGYAAQADVDRAIQAQRNLAGRQGGNTEQISRLLDKQILAITGAIDPKELSPTAYQGRIEALRREAARSAAQEEQAQKAVTEGLQVQRDILEAIRAIRSGILGGDASLLIQVENDTQARIDAENLKQMGNGLEPRGGLPVRSSQPSIGAGTLGRAMNKFFE